MLSARNVVIKAPNLIPPPGRATMPLLASIMVQGLIRPCAPLKPSIYAVWRHGKRNDVPI